jgi:hypothetical protein
MTSKTDTHVVEITSEEVRRSLFGEKKNVSGVRVDKEVMMYFELQFSNRLDKYIQGSSHGWTALDLFTADNTLK